MNIQARVKAVWLFALSVFVVMGIAWSSALAQDWDQVLPVAQRFVVLTAFNSAAVKDNETGLVWELSPSTGAVTFDSARYGCANKNVGGRKGWRIPSIPELASLIDSSVTSGVRLPPGHPFFTVEATTYWSATIDPNHPTFVWGVRFNNGGVTTFDIGSTVLANINAWCVRGGMNADRY